MKTIKAKQVYVVLAHADNSTDKITRYYKVDNKKKKGCIDTDEFSYVPVTNIQYLKNKKKYRLHIYIPPKAVLPERWLIGANLFMFYVKDGDSFTYIASCKGGPMLLKFSSDAISNFVDIPEDKFIIGGDKDETSTAEGNV